MGGTENGATTAREGIPAMPPPLRLELRGIRKVYPAVVANDGIDLAVAPGEIHAIVGENGAGKSTLMKVIYGMVRADAGEMLWNGREAQPRSPAEAQRLGVGMVFQHFALFDTLTVAENIALAMPDRPKLEPLSRRIAEVAGRYGLPVDPRRRIGTMSVGERQRVEIIRALLQDPGLLIMDEPTSVLTPQAVESLFVTLRRLAEDGCSILYISHKLEEVRALCSKATILRGGRVTGVCDPRRETAASMARMMIGADLQAFRAPAKRAPGAPLLVIDRLSLPSADPFGTALEEISLEVRAGEIVGVAGVSGNGQAELMDALSGERPCAPGAIRLDGRDLGRMGPRARRRLGLASAPEDRLGRSAAPELPLHENALLTARAARTTRWGFLRRARIRAGARRIVEEFGVRAGGLDDPAGSLSGGNLQKFVIGREILNEPRALVVAQPTWGVDVGAALTIRQALMDLRDRGAAVVVISEELDELMEISDRIAVIAGGRLTPAAPRAQCDRDAIGLAMSGRAGSPAAGAAQQESSDAAAH
ncbi:ABC transporter ATP-binding protein [Albimonas sp. CAU 1670]|uniref:ABC transporter ATP-binding protein n=1 Tax=Albimonas sp. CAU 1670 TaxID=3032599 RepID=UPI0023DA84E6|nr:ABC transporter ATP-binding protein [Albimonas sp. CAU 1670]MDF2235077.1 ABC transporter ATP-binding protein [Albimonas sp. CAU 1670]